MLSDHEEHKLYIQSFMIIIRIEWANISLQFKTKNIIVELKKFHVFHRLLNIPRNGNVRVKISFFEFQAELGQVDRLGMEKTISRPHFTTRKSSNESRIVRDQSRSHWFNQLVVPRSWKNPASKIDPTMLITKCFFILPRY